MIAKDSAYCDTIRSLMGIQYELLTNNHQIMPMFNTQDSLVTRARDKIANDFLQHPKTKDCTHLFMIDSDIFCSKPGAILKLIAADKDIMCGLYPTKSHDASRPVVVPLDKSVTMKDFDKPQELEYGGTGFILIKRHVLEQLKDKVEKYQVANQTLSHFFPSYIVDQEDFDGTIFKNLLSEDWTFCRLAREHGFQVWGQEVGLEHVGLYNHKFKTEKSRMPKMSGEECSSSVSGSPKGEDHE
jgi:hypothetical protein